MEDGWTPDPYRRGWLPADGPRWLAKLAAEHEDCIAALEEAQRRLDEDIGQAIAVVEWRGEEDLDGGSAALRALVAQAGAVV
jgi:hypothetical protein